VMLSEVDWRGRAEIEFLRLARSGLNSSWRKIETHFLSCARNWLLGHFFVHSLPSDVSPIGSSGTIHNHTNILAAWHSIQVDTLDLIRGYHRTWEDLDLSVSLTRRPGNARPIPAGRDPKGPCGCAVLRAPRNTSDLGSWLTWLCLGRRRSLVLYGPTRTGKTLWARSLSKHAYFGGLFCLDESLNDVNYAIFDDMQGGLKFFHAYKFWLGCQASFYATDKYKGKKLIHWGRPSIYIANQNPLCDDGVDHDWLVGNCDFIEVTDSLLMPVEGGLGEEL